jgi:hypothetical protein
VALPAAFVAVIVQAVLPALPAATAGNVWSCPAYAIRFV